MSRGHSVNGEVLDDCDRFKWRQCESDQDCEWEIWKTRPYDGQMYVIALVWYSCNTGLFCVDMTFLT